MLGIMARKTLLLSKKLNYALMRNIRDKITAYLLDEFERKGKKIILLPYNREELADYLSVDRSALSRELSKMRQEGLLRYRKNEFILDFLSTAGEKNT
jgi:CRP-like cAMP-binding protein